MDEKEESKRAFRKYKIEVTVLVEGSIPCDWSLARIVNEGDVGGFVIDWKIHSDPITGKEMADALLEARSESETFSLDEDGCDVDDG